jgi:hypothetical protein
MAAVRSISKPAPTGWWFGAIDRLLVGWAGFVRWVMAAVRSIAKPAPTDFIDMLFYDLGRSEDKYMTVKQIIQAKIDILPESKQTEVLNFLNSLIESDRELSSQQENLEWSQFSLTQAMQGLENDNLPEYTELDLLDKWQ